MLLPVRIDSKQGLIKWNFEELKKELSTQLKKFDNLVVVEEELYEYESVRAKLNKVKKLIDDERKRVKKEYSEPLSAFEKEVKELVGMVENVNSKIDVQLKEFEEIRKVDKQNLIYEFAEEFADEAEMRYVNFDLLFDSRWLNKTYSEKQWKDDIANKYQKISEDIGIIKSMNVENENMVLNLYLKHHDLALALKAHREFLELQQAKIPQKVEQVATPTQNALNEELQSDYTEDEQEDLATVFLSVRGTHEQLVKLQEYLEYEDNIKAWQIV